MAQTLELGDLQEKLSWFLALVRFEVNRLLWKCLIISACVSGNSFSTWTHQCTRQDTPKVLFHLSSCQQSSDSFLACYKSLNHIIVLPNTEGRESTEMNISFSTMVTIIFRLYPGEILKPRAKRDLIEYGMLCRVIFQHLAECVSPSQISDQSYILYEADISPSCNFYPLAHIFPGRATKR